MVPFSLKQTVKQGMLQGVATMTIANPDRELHSLDQICHFWLQNTRMATAIISNFRSNDFRDPVEPCGWITILPKD